MRRRHLAAIVLPLAVLLASCDGGSDAATDPASDAPTTTADDGAGGTDATTTTEVQGGGGSTTAPGGPGSAGGSSTSVAPPAGEGDGVIEIGIVGGQAEGGTRRAVVKQGAQVTIRATSDVADELHVHTYDLKVDLVPGQSADITFLARIPGVFEVELERRGTKVLELEVRP